MEGSMKLLSAVISEKMFSVV